MLPKVAENLNFLVYLRASDIFFPACVAFFLVFLAASQPLEKTDLETVMFSCSSVISASWAALMWLSGYSPMPSSVTVTGVQT